MRQLLPGAIPAPRQLLVSTLNSEELPPTKLALRINSGAVPLLVTVTACTPLVPPRIVSPKFKLSGDNSRPGAVFAPTPLTLIRC